MKYRVTIEYHGTGYAEVEAESEEEAISVAQDECWEDAIGRFSFIQHDAWAKPIKDKE